MQRSSDIEKSIGSVNGEGDNLTDSTSGSAGSGIGLLLASAAGKDGSLSGSGSGSTDSIRELGAPTKATKYVVLVTSATFTLKTVIWLITVTSRVGSSGILKKTATSSSWLFRPSSVDDDNKISSSSRARLGYSKAN